MWVHFYISSRLDKEERNEVTCNAKGLHRMIERLDKLVGMTCFDVYLYWNVWEFGESYRSRIVTWGLTVFYNIKSTTIERMVLLQIKICIFALIFICDRTILSIEGIWYSIFCAGICNIFCKKDKYFENLTEIERICFGISTSRCINEENNRKQTSRTHRPKFVCSLDWGTRESEGECGSSKRSAEGDTQHCYLLQVL